MKLIFAISSIFILNACSNTPDINLTYAQPFATFETTLTQTVACKRDKNKIWNSASESTVNYTTSFDNDKYISIMAEKGFYSEAIQKIENSKSFVNPSHLSGCFGGGDLTLQLTEDGRLNGVNSVSTGDGGKIIDSFVALAGVFTKGVRFIPDPIQCSELVKLGKEKDGIFTLTLNFKGQGAYIKTGDVFAPTTLKTTDISSQDFLKVERLFSKHTTTVLDVHTPKKAPHELITDNENYVKLQLTEPAVLMLSTNVEGGMANQVVLVPQLGFSYELPIAKSGFFGNQTFDISIFDNGRVNKANYKTSSGSADGLASIEKLYSAASKKETSAEKAEKLKAEGDIIKYQHRLVECKLDSTKCS
ncbi:hypothetical protein AADZ86_00870 [Colwelliaceae bacterium BS250]